MQPDSDGKRSHASEAPSAGPASPPVPQARGGYGANEIVSQIRAAIARKEYSEGDRLPSERELAAQFGVSRGTAKRALLQLEKMELVTRRIGSGTFVNASGLESTDDVAETTSPLELIEARFAIEPHMLRLAGANATSRDLERVRQALERLEAATDSEEFTIADTEFHLALAECSQNPLIVSLYRQISEVRNHAQWAAVKEKILSRDRIAQYNEQHRSIYLALATRDISSALAMMEQHLIMARSDLAGAQELPTAQADRIAYEGR